MNRRIFSTGIFVLNNKLNKMRKNVLIFGLILGTILCINMLIMVNMMYTNPEFKSNDLLGYVAMVVIFSLIFFGVRNYRNKVLDGVISFGKAFKTGLLIAVVASTLYVVVWLFYYYLFVPDFIDKYTAHVLHQCTTEAEMATKSKEMANFKELYDNPLFVVLITYSEVLPIGLVITLISAFILKRKPKK
jgi:amino acid transporter